MKNIRFLRRLFSNGSDVTLSFGHPIDIFGNKLDKDGNSIKNGRVIDIRDYFKSDGETNRDQQRNRVYSRYLANELVKSYRRENVVLTSHVAAFTAFTIFQKQNPNLDLYTLIGLPEDYLQIPLEEFHRHISTIQNQLKLLAANGELKMSREVDTMSPEELVIDALKNINCYHFYSPLKIERGNARCEDLKLLYFYHNRLFGYKLDRVLEIKKTQPFTVRSTLY